MHLEFRRELTDAVMLRGDEKPQRMENDRRSEALLKGGVKRWGRGREGETRNGTQAMLIPGTDGCKVDAWSKGIGAAAFISERTGNGGRKKLC